MVQSIQITSVVDQNIITTHYKDMGPWMKEALKIE